MSRRELVLVGLVVVQLALLGATFGWRALGTETWHHFASLGGVLVLAAMVRRPLVSSRRFLSIGVLATSVLATVSGFWLLYWKEGIRVDGHQAWGVFWHVAWSWAAAVFFVMHTWINRVALVHFMRVGFRSSLGALAQGGGYLLVVVAFLVTWGDPGRTWFSLANYIEISLYIWVAATASALLVWGLVTLRAGEGGLSLAQARPARRWVDVGLLPITALAVLSGLPLLLMDAWLDARGMKYVSKYWHVWPSVVFAVLAFVHTLQAWSSVRAHWRKAKGATAAIVAARYRSP